MSISALSDPTTLYDTDFYAWTVEQAAALRLAGEASGDTGIDWGHVADEIEDMGHERRNLVESLAEQIIAAFLQLEAAGTGDAERAALRADIVAARVALERRLTPSLLCLLESGWSDRYHTARRLAQSRNPATADNAAEACPYTVAQVLGEGADWFPRDGRSRSAL